MTSKTTAPFGTWKSPITSDLIVSNMVRMGKVCLDGDNVYWLETRPEEGGRDMVTCSLNGGAPQDVTPLEFNVRTRVHEFGGGSFSVFDNVVYFSNLKDQCIYRQALDANGKFSAPELLTPLNEVDLARHLRFADIALDAKRNRLIAVMEDHTEGDATPPAYVVAVALDGSRTVQTLVSGSDFYSSPKVSPDGSKIAWLSWNHPNMPWYGTELWEAEFNSDGSLKNEQLRCGGQDEAIFQPEWSPENQLYFCSDKTGWWNICRINSKGSSKQVMKIEAECGFPHMYFGHSSYAFAGPDKIISCYGQNGMWQLAELDVESGKLSEISSKFGEVTYVRANHKKAVFRGGAPDQPVSIVELDLPTKTFKDIRRCYQFSGTLADSVNGCLSFAKAIEYPTENGVTAHAFYYAPANAGFQGPEKELPPLIVRIHGGPNNQHFNTLDLSIQYWTSRGFAFVDVNYGGSTGFGRAYRQRLRNNWGVVDNQDAVNAARHLVKQGMVDPDRLVITGMSAGGYATICGVTFYDDFACGSAQFGVSDMEKMAQLFHKFQSHFLQTMIAPYPERTDVYKSRSAVNYIDKINCPLLMLHGLLDTIVPIEQSEQLAQLLDAASKPFAYVKFDDEPHVFRKAENVKKTMESELYFFAQVLGFQPADCLPELEIQHFKKELARSRKS